MQSTVRTGLAMHISGRPTTRSIGRHSFEHRDDFHSARQHCAGNRCLVQGLSWLHPQELVAYRKQTICLYSPSSLHDIVPAILIHVSPFVVYVAVYRRGFIQSRLQVPGITRAHLLTTVNLDSKRGLETQNISVSFLSRSKVSLANLLFSLLVQMGLQIRPKRSFHRTSLVSVHSDFIDCQTAVQSTLQNVS